MKSISYQIKFNSPAFLGNAKQSAQWRTPPIKAQLRQWWRVAYAASTQFQLDVAAMREAEGKLFGHAWLENDYNRKGDKIAARKSEVRIRLGQWKEGSLKKDQWKTLTKVKHPEVNKEIVADLYLGYGPVSINNSLITLKASAAIQAGEYKLFTLAYPDEHASLIEQALYLMHCFGTVGGRSRNGWGSYSLEPEQGDGLTGALPLRAWQDCLKLDWPHAIGQDDKGALLWHTQTCDDWKTLMKELAEIKIGLRTQFKFPSNIKDGNFHDRHWLSYPVTNHGVSNWNNLRLPNSLRFKVCPNTNGQLFGVIFHMPCLPPAAFHPVTEDIKRVWHQVHAFLDTSVLKLTRSNA